MEKGEIIVSLALTALVVLIALAIQRQWSGSTFATIASSAEDFVLKTTGLRDRIPELPGDERVRTFRMGGYSAALYRASPAPLVFAAYRFLIFGRNNKVLFKADSIEATTQPWTTLYDFAGTHGLPDYHKRGRSRYALDLTGDGLPDVLLGQYSGGDHCCTTVTVIELSGDKAIELGKISGLDGLPFEGLDLERLGQNKAQSKTWELVAHRPYRTVCGLHPDAADVISVYAYANGKFTDQTQSFQPFLERVLAENLARWKRKKDRSLHLLQSLAADYAAVGQAAQGEEFFQQNLPAFLPQLSASGVNPQACTQDVANLVSSISTKIAQK